MEHEFGRALPEGPVAEAWELVDLDEHQSIVADGPHRGAKLGELWRAGALGGAASGELPLSQRCRDSGPTDGSKRRSPWSLPIHITPSASATMSLKRGDLITGWSTFEIGIQRCPSKWDIPPCSQKGV